MINLFGLNFSSLKIALNLKSDLSIEDLFGPGIFAVQNTTTKRIFLVGVDNIFLEIDAFFRSLEQKKLKNPTLLEDYQKFGKESFEFFVIEADYTLENSVKRGWKIKDYKEMCRDNLY